MASEYSITRRVEFSETDLAGIMHFTNYYRWMEICEHEFLRSLGLSVDMEDENGRFGWPRVKSSCRFKRPLRFEEEVEVKLMVADIRDRSISYAFQFWKEDEGKRVKAAVGEAVADVEATLRAQHNRALDSLQAGVLMMLTTGSALVCGLVCLICTTTASTRR